MTQMIENMQAVDAVLAAGTGLVGLALLAVMAAVPWLEMLASPSTGDRVR